MLIVPLKDFKQGWFVGSFEPRAFYSKDVEVCCRIHPKGEFWPRHYHKIGTEINVLLHGSMLINNVEIKEGEVFIIYPGEWAEPTYMTDCEIVIIKVPSIPGDKYES